MNNIKIELHADDLGISEEINESIFQSIDNGLVRGVSVIIGKKDSEKGVLGSLKRKVRISLHLNLTDGKCLSNNQTKHLVDNQNNFNKNFLGLLMLRYNKDFEKIKKECKEEIREQIIEFKRISNLKEIPIDGHNHVHCIPWISSILIELSKEHQINWIRVPYEKFYISSLKNFFCFWFYVNIIKFIILRIFSNDLKKKLLRNNINFSSNFLGILETGHMKFSTIKNGLKKIINNKQNEKKHIEILIHPHYGSRTTFDFKGDRKDELVLAKNEKLKKLIYSYESFNSN